MIALRLGLLQRATRDRELSLKRLDSKIRGN
jgi:hypothetical protein